MGGWGGCSASGLCCNDPSFARELDRALWGWLPAASPAPLCVYGRLGLEFVCLWGSGAAPGPCGVGVKARSDVSWGQNSMRWYF